MQDTVLDSQKELQDRASPQTPHRGWGHWLLHRWPTALGIAIALLTAFDLQVDRVVFTSLAAIIAFMALVYLGAAVMGQRSSAWLLFIVGFVAIFVLRLLDLSSLLVFVFLGIAFVFWVVGMVRVQRRNRGGLALQTLGMIGFGALALSVLYIDLTLAGYLIAVALLAHAVWDAVHLWRNRVVAASYAEFCGVLDLVLGVTILVML